MNLPSVMHAIQNFEPTFRGLFALSPQLLLVLNLVFLTVCRLFDIQSFLVLEKNFT